MIREIRYLLIFLISQCCCLLFSSSDAISQTIDEILSVSFFPDNERIIITYYLEGQPTSLDTYDLVSGALSAYERRPIDATDRNWFDGSVSPDGSLIVFAIDAAKQADTKRTSQLAIMGLDGRSPRKITDGPGARYYPSFSPDGHKVIYARTNPSINGIETWDIFEVNLNDGIEKQLTHLQFWGIHAARYFPDGLHFIFSGEGVFSLGQKGMDALEKKYQRNMIYVMSKDSAQNSLVPYIQQPINYSMKPSVSTDGMKIAFVGGKAPQSGLHIYLKDGAEVRALTNLKDHLYKLAISPNGKKVAFITLSENPKGKMRPRKLWTIDTDGKNLTEVILEKK